jgi:hypothetical protein
MPCPPEGAELCLSITIQGIGAMEEFNEQLSEIAMPAFLSGIIWHAPLSHYRFYMAIC